MRFYKSEKESEKERNRPAKPPMTTRRTFLKIAAGAFVLLFGLGGTGKVLRRKDLLRPPGGQEEDAFIARCLKCDRCRSACPTSVIGLAHLADGITDARTPVMNFHLGYCTFCSQCVEVCPTRALKPFNPQTVKIGLAAVKKDICLAWNSHGCRICQQACYYSAITLDEEERPVVDTQRCNGCGMCENACPALALRTYIGGNVRGIVILPLNGEGGGNV